MGRRVSGRRSEDFVTGRKRKKNHCRWEGVSGRRSEDFYWDWSKTINCRWEGGWVEGGVKTLLLTGSTKKLSAGRRGVSGRRSEDFVTGRKRKKNHCRWEGVSGRRSEDFYWDWSKTINCRWEGGWVEGGVKTLLLTGSTKKLSAGRRGVSGRRSKDFITRREHKKIHCRCEGGGCVGESVTILSPAGGPTAQLM